MASRPEVLVCGCSEDDLSVLISAAGSEGPELRPVETAVKVAHEVVARYPVAVLLGVGESTLDRLDVIPMMRAMKHELPVIVIADEDSLDLERRAREKGVFYYLVHPVEKTEVEALFRDILRARRP